MARRETPRWMPCATVTATSVELAGKKQRRKTMAIPKTLREIDTDKARRLIVKHTNAGTGHWESSPYYSDFVYECGRGYKLIRPYGGSLGSYETGVVSM